MLKLFLTSITNVIEVIKKWLMSCKDEGEVVHTYFLLDLANITVFQLIFVSNEVLSNSFLY